MDANSNQEEVNATFKAEMKQSRADGEAFNQKKAANVALACVAKLKDPKGKYVTLSDEQLNVLTAMFYPTNEVRMKVIEATTLEAGIALDEMTKALLRKLLTPPSVEQQLKNMEKPQKKTLRDFLA